MHADHPSSATRTGRRWSRACFGAALLGLMLVASDDTARGGPPVGVCAAQPGAMDFCATNQCGPCAVGEGDCDPGQCGAGLTCVEEGAVDHCRSTAGCTPGAMDFCATSECGPCAVGEGDCDPGQCEAGLTCVEEGAVDHCRTVAGCTPGAMDFCATSECGPCAVGEGDCDPGQCEAGLTCVEEGAVDHCRSTAGCTPGASDFCATSECGPCADGEGDCDPGQCEAGLTCVEEGAVDHCRAAGAGASNLEVRLGGVWTGVCCDGPTLALSDRDCFWTEYDRTLTDQNAGLKLDCPEGSPTCCTRSPS
ncbi:MAG: hypothetical protein ABMB14_35135, partial [Myxococcota bacterium]